MKVFRRAPAPVFGIGDLVAHPQHGTGVVDAVMCVSGRSYYVSCWDGRGVKPKTFQVPRFVARGHELQKAEPAKVLVHRRR